MCLPMHQPRRATGPIGELLQRRIVNAGQRRRSHLELNTDIGVAENAVAGALPTEIVAEKALPEGLGSGAADARGRADREDERDDGHGQQNTKDGAEVMLEGALDPGNHGRKGAS